MSTAPVDVGLALTLEKVELPGVGGSSVPTLKTVLLEKFTVMDVGTLSVVIPTATLKVLLPLAVVRSSVF
jgi:hypothetical protein